MKALFGSLIVCFSMYTRIPMPQIQWEEENMQYAFCFFPLIGVLVGGLVSMATYFLSASSQISSVFAGVLATGIIMLFTGGIHLDGFLDTCDGIFCYGDQEKKLKVLADPQAGAFGVIYTTLYLLGMTAVFTQLCHGEIALPMLLVVPFILSRIIGGWMVIHWDSAKSSGLKHIFATSSRKKTVQITLLVWFLGLLVFGLWQSWMIMVAILVAVILLLLFLRFYCKRQFGGITGDLIGFTISIVELLSLFLIALLPVVL